ncbi:MAG: hypothetical protein ACTSV5_05670 [Promethearchaeota archaeon]
MFNFNTLFSIGIYNAEDDFSKTYSDGTAGINFHLHLEHDRIDRYITTTIIKPFSTGNVVNFGLLSNNIEYLNENDHIITKSAQFSTPSNYSVYIVSLNLYKKNNFTCRGTIEMSIESGGILINDTINFQVNFIVPLSLEDYSNINLLVYALFFIHFFLYVIIPVSLIWIFKPVFGLEIDEEDIERDKKFLKYLRKKREESEN